MTKISGIRGSIILILVLVIIIQLIILFIPYPFSLIVIAVGGPISTLLFYIRQQIQGKCNGCGVKY